VKQAVAPMVTKPAVPKPKTVAELIEANKIPVEKNFPVTKKEMKSTKLATEAYISPAQEKPVKAPIIGKTKFNDAELAEFKQLINYKLAEAIKDYELLKDTLSHRDNNGTDDTSPTFKLLEDGSEVMSKEETTQLAIRQEKFIQNLKNALIRIENKTYGVCRATGNMISKDRLRSVPHATLSIEAKRDQN
jgi:RNA polymerase-binding transcription factor DksA